MQNMAQEINEQDNLQSSIPFLNSENSRRDFSTDEESELTQEFVAQLCNRISAIELATKNIQNEQNSVLSKMQTTLDYLTTELRKMQEELSMQTKHLHLNSIIGSIRTFLRPRLGALYQYRARPLIIPKHYYANKSHLTQTPTISIVTPTFNQGRFIERTIKSILGQEYPALEYIVQDGGSKDETISILERYQPSLTHWQSAKDNGQSEAINKGFKHANGEIMAYINSDDILLPGTLQYVAEYFETHPDVDVIYGHRILIDEFDHEIGRWVLPRHNTNIIKWADYIPQETLFWRRRIWDKCGGKIDESFMFAMDWDLVLRFIEAGANFVRLPRFLGAFRVHTEQKTIANISNTGVEEMRRIRHRCHGRSVSYQEIKRNCSLYLIKHILLHRLYQFGILRY